MVFLSDEDVLTQPCLYELHIVLEYKTVASLSCSIDYQRKSVSQGLLVDVINKNEGFLTCT